MELLDRKTFIGDMPRRYRETIRGIRKALERRRSLLDALIKDGAEFTSLADQIKNEIEVLKDMWEDMLRARKTVLHYYESGGRYDDEYCLLGRIAGGSYHRLGSPVERLVAGGVRSFS